MSDVFEWGDRVALNPEGIATGLQGRARTHYGIVTGYKDTEKAVSVVKDGTIYSYWYHVDFWQKVDQFPWERRKERP